jgi:hypothetical protein
MWSSVGSAGTLDVANASEIVFVGAIAQLGRSIGGVHQSAAAAGGAAGRISPPKTTATMRYAVTYGLNGRSVGSLSLYLRLRRGEGRIVATLIEVPFPMGGDIVPDPGTVDETPLIRFDSDDPQGGSGPANQFGAGLGATLIANPNDHIVDNSANAYYVEVSLTAPQFDPASPTGIAMILLK